MVTATVKRLRSKMGWLHGVARRERRGVREGTDERSPWGLAHDQRVSFTD